MTAELSKGHQYPHPGGPTGVPRLLYPARTWEKTRLWTRMQILPRPRPCGASASDFQPPEP